MIKRIGVAAAVAFAFAGSAWAVNCPGPAQPFGSDDNGLLTCNKTASKCEQKVSGAVSKLAAGILKCQSKQASAGFKAAAFDEDACEAAAITKFKTTSVADCSCISLDGIASLAETVIDGANSQVYCDPLGTPFGGDDEGTIPSTKAILAFENGIGKCVPKLVAGYVKCHQGAAKAFLGNKTFDEEACEQGPIPGKPGKAAVEAFDACTAKVAAKGPGAGCEDLAGIKALTDAQLDGANNLVYCSSPSAAFVR
jgi:hypothetical protein